MQNIGYGLGDVGINWTRAQVKDFLLLGLSNGWCRRLPIQRLTGGLGSNLYFEPVSCN